MIFLLVPLGFGILAGIYFLRNFEKFETKIPVFETKEQ